MCLDRRNITGIRSHPFVEGGRGIGGWTVTDYQPHIWPGCDLGTDRLQERMVDDCGDRSGVVQEVPEILRSGEEIDQHRNRPDPHRPQENCRKSGRVVNNKHDPIFPPESKIAEAGSNSAHCGVQPVGGPGPIVCGDHHGIGATPRLEPPVDESADVWPDCMGATQAVRLAESASRPRSAIDLSRISTLRTLPVTVIGNSLTNLTYRGTLKWAILSR